MRYRSWKHYFVSWAFGPTSARPYPGGPIDGDHFDFCIILRTQPNCVNDKLICGYNGEAILYFDRNHSAKSYDTVFDTTRQFSLNIHEVNWSTLIVNAHLPNNKNCWTSIPWTTVRFRFLVETTLKLKKTIIDQTTRFYNFLYRNRMNILKIAAWSISIIVVAMNIPDNSWILKILHGH